ncbi:unnamed protein product [Protopolystoma xenopodis]|uniref:Uncharacterized protein n=1 Tax=Protopolystoma xenopodis TaxID=117903 RepID=A0A448XSR3_9PLAT|nr:unnamed protein product [Protopolystoma xenopodis]
MYTELGGVSRRPGSDQWRWGPLVANQETVGRSGVFDPKGTPTGSDNSHSLATAGRNLHSRSQTFRSFARYSHRSVPKPKKRVMDLTGIKSNKVATLSCAMYPARLGGKGYYNIRREKTTDG